MITLEFAEGQIQAVNSLVNPEKLGHLGEVGDTAALIAGSKGSRGSPNA